MRQLLTGVLVLAMVIQGSPAAFAAGSAKSQIEGMPLGTSIEVQLKNKQTLRGNKRETSDSGFTLGDPGGGSRQIAYDDVTSVKQLDKKSHKTRNILIVAGIGAVIVVAIVAVHLAHCPLGCNTKLGQQYS